MPGHAETEDVGDRGQYIDSASGPEVHLSCVLARVLDQQRDARDISDVRSGDLPMPFAGPKPCSVIRHDHNERAVIEAHTMEPARELRDQRVRISDLQ